MKSYTLGSHITAAVAALALTVLISLIIEPVGAGVAGANYLACLALQEPKE